MRGGGLAAQLHVRVELLLRLRGEHRGGDDGDGERGLFVAAVARRRDHRPELRAELVGDEALGREDEARRGGRG